jgi:hypothetical protein
MGLKEVDWESVDRMVVTEDRGQWWALVNTVMNLGVP